MAHILVLASILVFIPGLPKRYIDKNLQRAIKLALEFFVKGQKYD